MENLYVKWYKNNNQFSWLMVHNYFLLRLKQEGKTTLKASYVNESPLPF